MAWTTFKLSLAAGMLLTGSLNTLSTKAADQATTTNRYGESVNFNHPFFQALCMFIGEFSCLIAFYVARARARSRGDKFEEAAPFNPLIFLLPALCDMTATSLMYVGLSLTDASIFQMLRGSVVIFTGIASVLFLKNKDGSRRRLGSYQWFGMALVLLGTAAVGTASYACPASGATAAADASKALLGNSLILVAQVIVAAQMVVEETFISGYNVPALQVVGLEGLFGICALSVVLTIMYFVPAPVAFCLYPATGSYPAHCDHFEDAYDAVVQMGNNWIVATMLALNTLSIAFFNCMCFALSSLRHSLFVSHSHSFLISLLLPLLAPALALSCVPPRALAPPLSSDFGVSVTKHISASTRMVLDSLRTMIIWGFSLGVKWESFCYIQVVGFLILLSGTVVYNKIVKLPFLKYEDEEGEAASDEGKLAEGDSEALLLNESVN